MCSKLPKELMEALGVLKALLILFLQQSGAKVIIHTEAFWLISEELFLPGVTSSNRALSFLACGCLLFPQNH